MVGRWTRKVGGLAAAASEGEVTCKPRPPIPSPVALRKLRRLSFIRRRCSRKRKAFNAISPWVFGPARARDKAARASRLRNLAASRRQDGKDREAGSPRYAIV